MQLSFEIQSILIESTQLNEQHTIWRPEPKIREPKSSSDNSDKKDSSGGNNDNDINSNNKEKRRISFNFHNKSVYFVCFWLDLYSQRIEYSYWNCRYTLASVPHRLRHKVNHFIDESISIPSLSIDCVTEKFD